MHTSPFDDYFDTRADLKPYRLRGCSQINDCPWTICGYVPTKPIRSKIKEGFPASYRTFLRLALKKPYIIRVYLIKCVHS